jgi:GPN-loop GTPase
MSSLTRSMSLVLQEFYENLTAVSCSAVTGQGITELFAALDKSQEEYYRDYHTALLARIEENKVKELARQTQQMKIVQEDLRSDLSRLGGVAPQQRRPKPDDDDEGDNDGDHDDDDDDEDEEDAYQDY